MFKLQTRKSVENKDQVRFRVFAKFDKKKCQYAFQRFSKMLGDILPWQIESCHYCKYGREFEIILYRKTTPEEKATFLREEKESNKKYLELHKRKILREAKRLKLL